MIDWGEILTQLVVLIVTPVVTYVTARAINEWGNLRKNEKYGAALGFLEHLAVNLIRAAYELGEEAGWDGPKRKQYVIDQLRPLVHSLGLKLSDEQLEQLIDGIVEGVYSGMKGNEAVFPPSKAG